MGLVGRLHRLRTRGWQCCNVLGRTGFIVSGAVQGSVLLERRAAPDARAGSGVALTLAACGGDDSHEGDLLEPARTDDPDTPTASCSPSTPLRYVFVTSRLRRGDDAYLLTVADGYAPVAATALTVGQETLPASDRHGGPVLEHEMARGS